LWISLILVATLAWFLITKNKKTAESQKESIKRINALNYEMHSASQQICKLEEQVETLTTKVYGSAQPKQQLPDSTQTLTEPTQKQDPLMGPEILEKERLKDKAKQLHQLASAVPPITPATPPTSPTVMPVSQPPVQKSATVPNRQGVSNLEFKLGTRVAVILGAIAIALSGIFFVRYFAKNGMLTPPVRMSIAMLLGVALLVAGQFREYFGKFIRSGLVAAGIVTLYGTVYASTNLHELLPESVGLGFMLLLTLASIFLSLWHGRLVAILGLIGGMLTPALVGYEQLSATQLLGYVIVLQVGMTLLHHKMNWPGLKFLTLGLSMIWCLSQVLMREGQTDPLVFNVFILITLVTLGLSSVFAIRRGKHPVLHGLLNVVSLFMAMPMVVILIYQSHFDPKQWAFLGLLSLASLIVGRLQEKQYYLPGLAAGFVAVNLYMTQVQQIADLPTYMNWIIISFGLLFVLGFYACLWRSKIAIKWALLSVLSAAGYTLIYLCVQEPQQPWISLTIMAGVMALLSVPLGLKPQDQKRDILALFVGMMLLFGGTAIFEGLENQFCTLALGGLLVLLAALIRRLILPQLRGFVFGLAAILAGRLLLNSNIVDYALGEHLWQSWMVYTYLPVAVMCWFAGKLVTGIKDDQYLLMALDTLGGLLVWSVSTLLVYHAFYLGDWERFGNWPQMSLYTFVTSVVVWLVMVLAVMRFPRQHVNSHFLTLSYAVYLMSILVMLVFGVCMHNPLWTSESVGTTPVGNWLLYLYGLPMLLMLIVARWGDWEEKMRGIVTAGAVMGLTLAFVLICLQVRQVYHGEFLKSDALGLAEMYTYSAAWLVFAMLLFALGFWRRNAPLRYAGLAVMAVTIGKVFLLDTKHLEDIYRVLSFLCLGLCLFGVAVGYQFLLRKKRVENNV